MPKSLSQKTAEEPGNSDLPGSLRQLLKNYGCFPPLRCCSGDLFLASIILRYRFFAEITPCLPSKICI
jgi:hypothetical protein